MSDSVRLFIGARVSMATVRSLGDAVEALRPLCSDAGIKVRWVDSIAYHITLKFIGWSRVETIEAIEDRVGRALRGHRAFEISCRGLGAFPNLSKARVLWAGVEDSAERCARLARAIDGATTELGFSADKRAFHPHVTLGRLEPSTDLESVVAQVPEQAFSISSISSVVLFESKVKSTGSEYLVRAEWPLEAASKGSKRHTRRVEQVDHGDEQGPEEQTEDAG